MDLSRLPVPTHAELDGGPYFDAGVVITKDPESGIRNTSIQRFMVVAKDRLAINIDAGRHLEICLGKAAARGQPLPFTLNIGVGPGLHFAAATPAEAAPLGSDELGIASRFHGRPLQLVAGTTSKVEMVADAMFALECEMVPGEVHNEGPFAEVTGYYASVAPRPLVRVKKIHRRRQQALMAAFAAFPPLKMVTVVDDDVDIRDPGDVEWAMATRLDPQRGIMVIENVFGHGLNPTFPDYLGSKVGFDATRPFPHTPNFDRAKVRDASLDGLEIEVPEIR